MNGRVLDFCGCEQVVCVDLVVVGVCSAFRFGLKLMGMWWLDFVWMVFFGFSPSRCYGGQKCFINIFVCSDCSVVIS